jgi:phosphoribosylanthranilate isomerase
LIKAIRIGEGPIAENLGAFDVQAFLLDSKDDVLFGGTGKTFDWERAQGLKKLRPIILAGGLRPENVCEAIRTVNPYAVDVCSGVEHAPGKKNALRLKEFMNEVRNGCDFLQRP